MLSWLLCLTQSWYSVLLHHLCKPQQLRTRSGIWLCYFNRRINQFYGPSAASGLMSGGVSRCQRWNPSCHIKSRVPVVFTKISERHSSWNDSRLRRECACRGQGSWNTRRARGWTTLVLDLGGKWAASSGIYEFLIIRMTWLCVFIPATWITQQMVSGVLKCFGFFVFPLRFRTVGLFYSWRIIREFTSKESVRG